MIANRDTGFVGAVAKAQSDLDDFKNAQLVGGSSIILSQTQTTNTWDVLNADLTSVNPSSTWSVTFTPDDAELVYAEFCINFLFHDTAYGFEQLFYYIDPTYVTTDGTRKYTVFTLNSNGYTTLLNMKFGIISSSTGSLSWVRTSS